MATDNETTPLLAEQQTPSITRDDSSSWGDSRQRDSEDGLKAVEDEPKIPGCNLGYIVPAMAIGIFLAAMDNTIVVSSYGAIGSEMKELNKTSWIATAYLLTTTSFQPLYGKLSDIFGRKEALLFAYAVFGLGCLGCGLARNMSELVAARAFAGIGGGGMTTVVSILISDLVPLRSRGTWQGCLNIVFASGAATGAPLGGMLADSVGWRWSFLFQFPACLVAITVVSLALHLPPTPSADTTFKSQLKRVDFTGALVLIAAVLALLIGLDRGGNVSISDPLVIASLSVSFVLFILFILIEGYVAAEPFAPGRIVTNRSIFACCFANFFSFGGYMAILFHIPLYYQAVSSLSAGSAGVRLLPAIGAGVTGSLTSGIIMQKTGRYYYLTIIAYIIFFLGTIPVLLFTGTIARSVLGISFGIAGIGLGNGIGVTSTLIALIAAAGPKDQAVATAVSYLFRALGTVAGVSISSMLVQGSLRRELNRVLQDDEAEKIVRLVRGSLDGIKDLPPATRKIVMTAYQTSLQSAFILGIFCGVFAVISSTLLKEKRLGN